MNQDQTFRDHIEKMQRQSKKDRLDKNKLRLSVASTVISLIALLVAVTALYQTMTGSREGDYIVAQKQVALEQRLGRIEVLLEPSGGQ